jgi:hypothetical protein
MPHHIWSNEDDIVAFYLYRFGPESLMMTVGEISEILGMSEKSLKTRIKNFEAIDGADGLPHYTKQSKTIFNEYKNVSQETHRNVVIKILEK